MCPTKRSAVGLRSSAGSLRASRDEDGRGRTGWHLDEMFVSINGRQLYVWRVVDGEGEVVDILVQPRQDRKAALKLMRKLLKKQGITPATIVTDKLCAARTWCCAAARHRSLEE